MDIKLITLSKISWDIFKTSIIQNFKFLCQLLQLLIHFKYSRGGFFAVNKGN